MEAIDSDVSRNIIISKSNLNSNTDLLFRIQQGQQSGNTPPTFTITVRATESVSKPIAHLINENTLFMDIVKNLWQLYKYHQEYELFLLGGCSEAEFLAVAERYAISFQSMPAQRLTFGVSLLLNILPDPLTSSDLSVLLNVDPSEIESTLRSSSGVYAVPLEYQDSHGE